MPSTTRPVHDLRARIEALGPWFQNIELAPGVWTNPGLGDHTTDRWRIVEPWVPADLQGQSVLDMGCNAGYFSVRMKERGAGRVVGIDLTEHYLQQARFTADHFGHDIEFRQMDAYDINVLGEFDIVMCFGLLYHLKHPLFALERVAQACRTTLYFQSVARGSTEDFQPADDYPLAESGVFLEPAYPKLFFVERSVNGDATNWWFATHSCLKAMLRVAGFGKIQTTSSPEIFVCGK